MAKRHTRDDIDTFHEHDVYLPTRTIYVGSKAFDMSMGESGTDGAMAEHLVKNLHLLDSQSDQPISIIMHNYGGDTYAARGIVDAIQACRSEVSITIFGVAMSSGSIILQAADRRIMAPLATQMIHYGTYTFDDHALNAERAAAESKRLNEWLEQFYLERMREKNTKFSLNTIKRLLRFDTFLTAEQSVELGLCDSILGVEDGK